MAETESVVEKKTLSEQFKESVVKLTETLATVVETIDKASFLLAGVSDGDRKKIRKAEAEGRNWRAFSVIPHLYEYDEFIEKMTSPYGSDFLTKSQPEFRDKSQRKYMNFTDLPKDDPELIKWINSLEFVPLEAPNLKNDNPFIHGHHRDDTIHIGYETITEADGTQKKVPVAMIEKIGGGVSVSPSIFLDLKHQHHFVIGGGSAAQTITNDLRIALPAFELKKSQNGGPSEIGITPRAEWTRYATASQYIPSNTDTIRFFLDQESLADAEMEKTQALNYGLSMFLYPENIVRMLWEPVVLHFGGYDPNDIRMSGPTERLKNRATMRSNVPIVLDKEIVRPEELSEDWLKIYNTLLTVEKYLGVKKGFDFLCLLWDAAHVQTRFVATEDGKLRPQYGIVRQRDFNWEY